ncbi:chromate efflux transporter [Paenibacillus sp. GCM10023248]|uniref:chromate efflux transporter n=1 Tax=unclassified Paenibacillus TaxID=185978 RepID=UPI002377E76F|nr:chromate efflux transporter [Paenibacillus sp. MAHUQ-63]MDD9269025.1 chromate efflux transporter [Paenibacillus sp. MAHUQ-63]
MEMKDVGSQPTGKSKAGTLLEILAVSTKLGLTSFGGPIAHLGYFHNEYIRRRKWMDESSYGDLVALCQFLPGPASSQLGMAIGLIRGGMLGGLAAWLGFTLPSAIALFLFAMLLHGADIGNSGWIHGLKIVAVAVVAQALVSMGQKLTPDRTRITIAIAAAAVTLMWQTAFSQILLIVLAGIAGILFYSNQAMAAPTTLSIPVSRRFGAICLAAFFGLLVLLPALRQVVTADWLSLFDSFYRSGSLVFGGGHVVLPLLEREVVPADWVSKADFLAGYGAAQAVPGPLFTFASYLGGVADGWAGAAIATVAIFLPAFLLIVGALPFWNSLRSSAKAQGALAGIGAAVVGILLAALYHPLWTSAILAPADFVLASILFVLLVFWKVQPWIVVLAGAAGGTLAVFL